ncbi:M4 family metallopeptidase [Brevibacterium daeguense]|uniref:Neutral metalloproteinase n=1 Tax=Brevibacterium daeguense TaxID=909936 RepID=A0ABP8EKA5_9MICO|nr:M4 family metallopeptidase [Brevibacterium daeguense]
MTHFIVPPHLLRRIAALDEESAGPAPTAARRALREIDDLHRFRVAAAKEPTVRPRSAVAARSPGLLAPSRRISDAQCTESLPGVLVRAEGQDPTGDPAVDEAYEHLGDTYRYFAEVHGRDSMDGLGMPLPATVHYGVRYENAFWDGTRMVFGDGDGVIFNRFTASLSVVAHELVHGMTQFVTQLSYHGQAGAIHESVSDVFGALVEQYSRSQTAGQAHWLIGAELFTPRVSGAAIRSMAAPGTAYDDERLGRDPQPATMDGYLDTEEDSGGVHLNSGIPNHAFYRAAVALGGYVWEHVGRVWYDTVTVADLPSDCSFSLFAEATRTAAERRFGSGSAVTSAVEQAWDEVGVRLPGRSQVLS